MKKSTLLSLITAGAIVTTTAGTFAAWDQMSVTSTTSLTLDKPVVMTLKTDTLTPNRVLNEIPTYTGTSTLNIENIPTNVTAADYEIKYTAVVKNGGSSVDGISAKAVDTSSDQALAGEHTVTVTVTPTEAANVKDLATKGTPLTVEVTAELVKKQPAA